VLSESHDYLITLADDRPDPDDLAGKDRGGKPPHPPDRVATVHRLVPPGTTKPAQVVDGVLPGRATCLIALPAAIEWWGAVEIQSSVQFTANFYAGHEQ
jgi:hypothetical protein